MISLFVDTSGWVALFDGDDKYHHEASQAFTRLQEQTIRLLTSDYVIDEVLTYLLYHAGWHTALRFGRWALQAEVVEIAWIDEVTWRAAWSMFESYEDNQWAFTDCTSFILMQRRSIWQAFAFDHHFEQAGFQLWPDAF